MARRRIGRVGGTEERPAVFFTGPEEFRAWLEAHHQTAPELWMGLNQRMAPAGMAAYEARREDQTGVYSYENTSPELSPDHAALLAADARAAAFWAEATPSYQKVCVAWVCSAKQHATRDRRMAQLVDDCAHGRLIKSQTCGDPPRWLVRAAAAARAARR